jgi:hypothetical protein
VMLSGCSFTIIPHALGKPATLYLAGSQGARQLALLWRFRSALIGVGFLTRW